MLIPTRVSIAPRTKLGILSSYISSLLPEIMIQLFLNHLAFSKIHHHLKTTRCMSTELLERNREIKIYGGEVTRNMYNILGEHILTLDMCNF